MEKYEEYEDVRYCPWEVSTIGGIQTRVYRCYEYECGVTSVHVNYPHAPVYHYSLKYPDGTIQHNLDLAEVNGIIFNRKYKNNVNI